MGVHKNLRFCPFCEGTVEDELHFLIDCPIYKNLRKPVMDSLSTENINNTPTTDVFITLMTKSIREVANFTHKAFELREFLINKPKQLD